jgi:hypothetical protein
LAGKELGLGRATGPFPFRHLPSFGIVLGKAGDRYLFAMKHAIFTILLPALVLLVSCRKEESSNLDDDTAIYQDYKVIFDKPENRTRAFATFRRANSWGVRLLLTGGAGITFNGNSHTSYTELDNYFYRWNSSGITDVQFYFTKADGSWFQNSITRNDTLDIIVPLDGVVSRTNGGQVFWIGQPLLEGEKVEAQVKQGSTSSTKITVSVAGAQSVVFPASALTNLTEGTGQLYLTRSRTMPLNEGDANAGGRRIVEVEARGTITVE